ncbi:MAG: DUF4266 domain-containing protein [Candidatus Poseidoniia archaeon]
MTRALAALLLVLLAGACTGVRPWERDVLARTDMQWQPDPLEAAMRTHVAFSKEGALVGGGAGGGGCGCN